VIGLAVTMLGRQAQLLEVPRPVVGDTDVLMRVHYSGLSMGSELGVATGRDVAYGPPPFVNGYQASGVVAAVGPGVTSFGVGDLVAAFCPHAHAQYALADMTDVHLLAADWMILPGALFVQPCVAANALNQATVATGDTVMVVGLGLVGQSAALLSRLRGAFVIAADVSAERLTAVSAAVADQSIVIDPGASAWDSIRGSHPRGVGVVIEASGEAAALDGAMRCCAHGGRFIHLGWYPGRIDYTFQVPHAKQLRAFYPCSIGERPVREGILRMIQSRWLDITSWITHVIPWRESPQLYERLMSGSRPGFNGVVIDWTSD
jgi:threonine dehydrogenase-like Zn-dependent dehydrogenase